MYSKMFSSLKLVLLLFISVLSLNLYGQSTNTLLFQKKGGYFIENNGFNIIIGTKSTGIITEKMITDNTVVPAGASISIVNQSGNMATVVITNGANTRNYSIYGVMPKAASTAIMNFPKPYDILYKNKYEVNYILDTLGRVFAMGTNIFGATGQNDTIGELWVPTLIEKYKNGSTILTGPTLPTIVHIESNGFGGFMLDNNGDVYMVGKHHKIEGVAIKQYLIPTKLTYFDSAGIKVPLPKIAKVRSSATELLGTITYLIDFDGKVYAIGDGLTTGRGATFTKNEITRLDVFKNGATFLTGVNFPEIVDIATTAITTVFIDKKGFVYSMGDNTSGKLGQNIPSTSTTKITVPTKLNAFKRNDGYDLNGISLPFIVSSAMAYNSSILTDINNNLYISGVKYIITRPTPYDVKIDTYENTFIVPTGQILPIQAAIIKQVTAIVTNNSVADLTNPYTILFNNGLKFNYGPSLNGYMRSYSNTKYIHNATAAFSIDKPYNNNENSKQNEGVYKYRISGNSYSGGSGLNIGSFFAEEAIIGPNKIVELDSLQAKPDNYAYINRTKNQFMLNDKILPYRVQLQTDAGTTYPRKPNVYISETYDSLVLNNNLKYKLNDTLTTIISDYDSKNFVYWSGYTLETDYVVTNRYYNSKSIKNWLITDTAYIDCNLYTKKDGYIVNNNGRYIITGTASLNGITLQNIISKINHWDSATIICDDNIISEGSIIKVKFGYQVNEYRIYSIAPQVAVGKNFSLILDSKGKVYLSGNQTYSIMPTWGSVISNLADLSIPTQLTKMLIGTTTLEGENLPTIVSIAVGENHALLLDNKGRVFGLGNNQQYQLALTTDIYYKPFPYTLIPKQVLGVDNKRIVAISAGSTQSLLLDDMGRAYAVGLISNGATGIAANLNSYVKAEQIFTQVLLGNPIDLVTIPDSVGLFESISAGVNKSIFISKDHQIYFAGSRNTDNTKTNYINFFPTKYKSNIDFLVASPFNNGGYSGFKLLTTKGKAYNLEFKYYANEFIINTSASNSAEKFKAISQNLLISDKGKIYNDAYQNNTIDSYMNSNRSCFISPVESKITIGQVTINQTTVPGFLNIGGFGSDKIMAVDVLGAFYFQGSNVYGEGTLNLATTYPYPTRLAFNPNPTPSKLKFFTQPSAINSNQLFNPIIKVGLYDALDSPIKLANKEITVNHIQVNNVALIGNKVITDTGGIANFTNFTVNGDGGTYNLVATSSGLLEATSNPYILKQSDAFLSGIVVGSSLLKPLFSKDIFNYTIDSISGNLSAISIAINTDVNRKQTIKLNGSNYTLNAISTISLTNPKTIVTIEVTAEDGVTVNKYTITLNRQLSSNVNLQNLLFNTDNPSKGKVATTYLPVPTNAINTYSTYDVPFDTSTIFLKLYLQDTRCTVKVNGTNLNAIPIDNNSQFLIVPIPTNEIEIIITAEDGITTRKYIIPFRKIKLPDFSFDYSFINSNTNEFILGRNTPISPSISTIITSGPISSFTITPTLPTGIIFNGLTGTISGTPTLTQIKKNYILKGINAAGFFELPFTIQINPPSPKITTLSPLIATVGNTINITGANFELIKGIKLGNFTIKQFYLVNSGTIQFDIPYGAVSGNITVSTEGGNVTSAQTITLLTAPIITYSSNNYSFNTYATITPIPAPTKTQSVAPNQFQNTTTVLAGNKATPGIRDGTADISTVNNPGGVAVDKSGNVYVADRLNNRIRKISNGVVSTFSGNGYTNLNNGTGLNSSFNNPNDIVINEAGDLFVTDMYNNAIRKLNNIGTSSTIVSNLNFTPTNITLNAKGVIYVSDNTKGSIWKIDPNASPITSTIIAGSTTLSYANANGINARFSSPSGLAIDTADNIYVADKGNNRIRIIKPNGDVENFAGSGTAATVDGSLLNASFNAPYGLSFDIVGNLYVTEGGNKIRKIDTYGNVSTIADNTDYKNPSGIAIDNKNGAIIIADSYNYLIKKYNISGYTINPALPKGLILNNDGSITGAPLQVTPSTTYSISSKTFVGQGTTSFTLQTNAIPPTITSFLPLSTSIGLGVTVRGTGLGEITSITIGGLAVSNYQLKSTTELVIVPAVGTLSGNIVVQTLGGNATSVGILTILTAPQFSYSPNSYDFLINNIISSINPIHTGSPVVSQYQGAVSTYAGTGVASSINNTNPLVATFNAPSGLLFDPLGNMYVSEKNSHLIRKISPTGVVTLFAGAGFGNATGNVGVARFNQPNGMVTDQFGNVFILDEKNLLIRKVDILGNVSTFYSGLSAPMDITIDNNNNLYVLDNPYSSSLIKKIDPTGVMTIFAGGQSGYLDGTGTNARFNYTYGIVADANNNLYVADYNNHRIRKITPSGVVTTLAGNGTIGSVNGLGANARFNFPNKITIDKSSGYLYVTELGAHLIRKVSPNGEVTTLAGSIMGNVDGDPSIAKFNKPTGIAVNYKGDIFVADQVNNKIRKIAGEGYKIEPNLPTGLVLNTDGSITGTPTQNSTNTNYKVTAANTNALYSTSVNIAVNLPISALLSQLLISQSSLSPVFNSAVYDYNVVVLNSVSSIAFTPTAIDPTATISLSVNGASATNLLNGTLSSNIALNMGVNRIVIKVVSRDGLIEKIYTINVKRISNIADLSSLSISQTSILPTFSTSVLNYASTVEYTTDKINITPTATDALSTILVNGVAVVSGTLSTDIALNMGMNTINIKVTADNGTTIKNYVLTVNRNTPTVDWTKYVPGVTDKAAQDLDMSDDGNTIVTVDRSGFLYLSTDGGASFTKPGLSSVNQTSKNWMAASVAADGQVLVAATNSLIYISRDRGVTWTSNAGLGNIYNLSVSDNGLKLMVATLSGYIYYSADGGITFTTGGSTSNHWMDVAFSNNGNTLWAASNGVYARAGSGSGLGYQGGLYKSTDAGANWNLVYADNTTLNIDVSNDGKKIILSTYGVSNGKIITSTDGGQNWLISNNSYAKIRKVAISDNGKVMGAVFANGVMLSKNNGESFEMEGALPFNTIYAGFALSNNGIKAVVCELNTPGNVYGRNNIDVGKSIDITANFNLFNYCADQNSVAQNFAVEANGLTNNLLITAPAGFEVSLNANTGYVSSLAIIPVSGVVATTIYIRVAATATGALNDQIIISTVGVTAKSLAVTASTYTAEGITSEPSTLGQTICLNETLTPLSVTATGNALTYQWYENTTNTNSGGTAIVGATANTYTPLTGKVSTKYYYAMVTGACGNLTSNIAGAIKIKGLNTISLTSATGSNNQTGTINVPINTINYTTTGATSANFSVFPTGITASFDNTNQSISILGTTTNAANSNYTITLVGGCGNITAVGNITIYALTSIATQPSTSNESICVNAVATTLNVVAVGNNLNYQWYVNTINSTTGGTLISGATTASLTPSTAQAGSNYYYVVITGTTGTITSTVSGAITVSTPTTGTITLTSAVGTNNQTICNNAITDITYALQSPFSAIVTGLPAGLISSTIGQNLTISGTPTGLSLGTPITYQINLTGGCVNTAEVTTGTIVKNVIKSHPSFYGSNYLVNATASNLIVELANTSGASYQWYSNTTKSYVGGATISGATSATYSPSTAVSGSLYYYATVTGCGETMNTNISGAIISTDCTPVAKPTISTIDPSYCVGTSITLTATPPGTGNTSKWYTAATGGTLLSTANTYSVTPTTTTTYYVNADVISNTSNALAFDGTSDYVDIGTPLPNNSNFTIEAWVNSGTGAVNIVSSNRNPFYLSGSRLYAAVDFSGSDYMIRSTNLIPDNTWVHVAVSFDRDNGIMRLFINGIEDINNSPTGSTRNYTVATNEPTYIGAIPSSVIYTAGYWYNGKIDEVRIWNTVRTPDQIRDNRSVSLVGNETGLVDYYTFNQGTAARDNSSITTLTNSSTNSIAGASNGTLVSFANTGSTSNFVEGQSFVTSCPSARVPVTVTINPISAGGTATASNTAICEASTTTLSVSGFTGTIHWQESVDGVSWNNVLTGSNATLANYTTANLTSSRKFRAAVTSGNCSVAYSNVVNITVAKPVAGVASIDQVICAQTSPANITLAGASGSIQWQNSGDNISFNNITSAHAAILTSVQMGTITTTTYYKAIVSSAGCTNVESNMITVGIKTPTNITGALAVGMNAGTEFTHAEIGGVWTSNNNTIATVNTNGLVTGVGEGTAIIKYAVCGYEVTKSLNIISNDASLINLTTSNGSFTSTFNSNTNQYTVALTNDIVTIQVTPTKNHVGASIKVNGIAVTSGIASAAISVTTGDNIVLISILAADGVSINNYSINFKLPKKKVTIALTSTVFNKIYGQADPSFTYTVTPSLDLGDAFTGSIGRVQGNEIGTYLLNMGTLTAGPKYEIELSTTPSSLTIAPKPITITGISGVNKIYDGTVIANVTGTAVLNGIINGDDVNIAGAPVYSFNQASVGSNININSNLFIITGIQAGNYSLTQPVLSANITKAELTVKVKDDSRFITLSDVVNYADVSIAGFVNGETETIIDKTNLIVSRTSTSTLAGVYQNDLSATGLTATNYTFNYQQGDYTIIPAEQLQVIISNTSTIYGAEPIYSVNAAKYLFGTTVVAIPNSDITVNGKLITINDGITNVTFKIINKNSITSTSGKLKTGSYTLMATEVTGNSANFNQNIIVNGAEIVQPKPLTISATTMAKTYDGNDGISNPSVAINTPIIGDDIIISGIGVYQTKDAGIAKTYTINNLVLKGNDASNYYINGNSTTFTSNNGVINKKVLTISTVNNTKIYRREDPFFSVNYSGFVNGENETIFTPDPITNNYQNLVTNRVVGEQVGTYAVNPSGLSNDNYTIEYVSGLLTITPLNLTISGISAITKEYDGNNNVAVTGNATFIGLYPGDNINLAGTANYTFNTALAGEDKVVLVAGFTLAGNSKDNYTLSLPNLQASITPKILSIQVVDKIKFEGATDPSNEVIMTGFIVGESTNSLTGNLTYTRNTGETVGYYDIKSTGLTSLNYQIQFIPGKLEIELNHQDTDGDGVPDFTEIKDGTNPGDPKNYKDIDGDKVPDFVEATDGTDANDKNKFKDTDTGGVPDFVETVLYPINGLPATDINNKADDVKDTDQDGVPDYIELIDGTDPGNPNNSKDADGDKVPDYIEIKDGTNPNNPLSYKDTDKDGVPDYIEIKDGTDPNDKTKYTDTDKGGVSDYVETVVYPNMGLVATDINLAQDDKNDSDKDGVPDGIEIIEGTDPTDASAYLDTDLDGVPNNVEKEEATDPFEPKEYKDTDGDKVPDYIEKLNGTSITDSTQFLDTDSGGVPDYVEKRLFVLYALTPTDIYNPADDKKDTDADGETDYEEIKKGTDPVVKDENIDTDGDSVPDYIEIIDKTNINDPNDYLDEDKDLVPSFVEKLDGTDPLDPKKYKDTDGDLVPDYIERRNGTDLNVKTLFLDTDKGGVPDYVESVLLAFYNLPLTNSLNAADDKLDSDGDGVPDYIEIKEGTNPNDPNDAKDTDHDKVPDFVEEEAKTDANDPSKYPDTDKDGVPDFVEIKEGTDPNNGDNFKDTDGGGIADYVEAILYPATGFPATDINNAADDVSDKDNDKVPDNIEVQDGTNPNDPDAFKDSDGDKVPDFIELKDGTSPTDINKFKDTDKDGVPDYIEEKEGTDLNDATKFKDSDKDGVPDYTEIIDGTNPNDPKKYKDTDGDKVPDYVEKIDKTDPLNNYLFKDTDKGGMPDYVELVLLPLYNLSIRDILDPKDDIADYDKDGVPDYIEFIQGTDPTNKNSYLDSDGDLVPDNVEIIEKSNPFIQSNYQDSDGDLVPDYIELRDGTDRFDANKYLDTDKGGIADYIETILKLIPTNINVAADDIDTSLDSDGDGVPDIIEIQEKTNEYDNKNYLDSDNDLVPDYIEIIDGTNPFDRYSFKDTDNGGVPNYVETILYLAFNLNAGDPNNKNDDARDTDGDTIIDYYEFKSNTTIFPVDTDGDGVLDFEDLDSDNDGIADIIEARLMNNDPADTDKDGIPDFRDLDADNDGITDFIEKGNNGVLPLDSDKDGIPNYLDLESDGDGVLDTDELKDNTDAFDPCSLILIHQTLVPNKSWMNADCNADGIANGEVLIVTSKTTKPVIQPDLSIKYSYIINIRNIRPEKINKIEMKYDLIDIFNNHQMEASISSISTSGNLTLNNYYSGYTYKNILDTTSSIEGNATETVQINLVVKPNSFIGNIDNLVNLKANGKWGIIEKQSIDSILSSGRLTGAGLASSIKIAKMDFHVYPTFSPNNDGVNDTWVITRPYHSNVSIKVFNRWGSIVFEESNYQNDWRGKGLNNINGQDVPEGTYFYVVELKEMNGSKSNLSGSLTIVR